MWVKNYSIFCLFNGVINNSLLSWLYRLLFLIRVDILELRGILPNPEGTVYLQRKSHTQETKTT